MIGVGTASPPREAAELLALMADLGERVARLESNGDRARPVVLPAYGSARKLPNLTPLLALLLRRYGVPVLLHGPADDVQGSGRVTTVAVLGELGIEPAGSLAEAQQRLARRAIAFVPIALLAPELLDLPTLGGRHISREMRHTVGNLIDPFGGGSFRVVTTLHDEELARMRAFLAATRADALLLPSSEGEPFANPHRQPRLECFAAGRPSEFVEMELSADPLLPRAADAASTAEWTIAALAGEQPIPRSIVNQLACCLLGARCRSGTAFNGS